MADTPTKKKILIVDDDSFLLDMYAMKFTQAGLDVDTALGSVPALEKVKAGANPDVLLLDIVMPVMDGFEFLQKLREGNFLSNTIKVVLSNRGAQTDIEQGKALGAAGYIVKANSIPSEVVDQVKAIAKL